MTYAIQQDKLCAFQSRKLEDFIDSERQEVRLQLEPQGVLNVVITFENTLVAPLYTPVKGLRRQQGLIHIKQQQGKKLIRPADLNIDIGNTLTFTKQLVAHDFSRVDTFAAGQRVDALVWA